MTPPTTRSGRPSHAEAVQLTERLREAALEVFLDRGFEATTMEAVARAAGITKRTLYGRHPDKRGLFVDVVGWALARQRGRDALPDVTGMDLAAALTTLGRSILTRAIDPDIVRLGRIAAMESVRFPEFADSAQSLMWSPRMRATADLLRRHADAGDITVDDIEIAAEQFIAMVSAVPARLAEFGVTRPPEAEERHLHHAVRLFLNGVQPRP